MAAFLVGGYLLTLKQGTRASRCLGLYIFSTGIVSAGFFSGHLIYHPFGAYHRYLTVTGSMLGVVVLAYFPFTFPSPWRPREARATLAVALAAASLCAAWFFWNTFGTEPVIDFSTSCYTFPNQAAIPGAALLLLGQIYFFATMIRRVRELQGPPRASALSMTLVIAGLLIPLMTANLLRQAGQIDSAVHQTLFAIGGLLGYFFVIVVFINHTVDRTSFMVKIVGLCLLACLLVVQATSTVALKQREALFDSLRQRETSSLVEGLARRTPSPSGFLYMAQVPLVEDPLKVSGSRIFKQLADGTPVVAYRAVSPDSGATYEVGYSYADYRAFIHEGAFPLNLLALGLFGLVLLVFPVFFSVSMVDRMKSLMRGLHEVDAGNLEVQLTPGANDEIGFLAQSFNKMTESIRQSKHVLEDRVRARTAELDAALASRNKTLAVLDRQLQMARDIQQGIIAQNYRNWNEASFAAEYHPMETVSGDYIDIAREEDCVWILAADVSGHGIPAALVTMAAKEIFSRLFRTRIPPSEVFSRVNQHMVDRVKTREYLTAFLLRIDTENRITFSNAGHPDPLIYRRASHAVECLESPPGMFLGVMPVDEGTFADSSGFMEPGDRVFLFTDGILEACRGAEPFGEERLAAAILNTAAMPLKEALAEIVADCARFTGGAFQDDLSLIAVEAGRAIHVPPQARVQGSTDEHA